MTDVPGLNVGDRVWWVKEFHPQAWLRSVGVLVDFVNPVEWANTLRFPHNANVIETLPPDAFNPAASWPLVSTTCQPDAPFVLNPILLTPPFGGKLDPVPSPSRN